jgi:hypothetical protein
MSMDFKTLNALSDDDLIRQYDEQARHTVVGLNYYTEEIARRRNENSNKLMIKLTRQITFMTAAMLFFTIIVVVITVIK